MHIIATKQFGDYDGEWELCTICGQEIVAGDRCHACVQRELAKKREKEYQHRKLVRHLIHKWWIATAR